MALTPNGIVIKGPRCPDVNPYGLLSAVTPAQGLDPHWMSSGFEIEELLCGPSVTGFIDECPPADPFVKPAVRSNQYCHVDPFVLIGSYQCPPVGRPADEAYEIARQRLLKWEGYQLEQTVWTGVIANGTGLITPSFAFGNPDCDIVPEDVSPGGAVDPVAAISLLETALGNTSGCGIIHVPYGLGAYLKYFRLLEKDGDEYYTPTGFRVVLGHGYPGTGPANVAASAGESWIFATGPMVLASSDLMQVPENIAEGFNRMVNDVEIRAERFYAVGFTCGLFAVRVALCDLCL
jgi:hypothetical protein